MAYQPPPDAIRAPLLQHLHDYALSDPIDALRAVRWLTDTASDLEALAVSQARQAGATWAEIARLLGATTPTIHRRFRYLDAPPTAPASPPDSAASRRRQ